MSVPVAMLILTLFICESNASKVLRVSASRPSCAWSRAASMASTSAACWSSVQVGPSPGAVMGTLGIKEGWALLQPSSADESVLMSACWGVVSRTASARCSHGPGWPGRAACLAAYLLASSTRNLSPETVGLSPFLARSSSCSVLMPVACFG